MSAVTEYLDTMEKALAIAEGLEVEVVEFDGIEEKVRRVRTAAGARRFGAPINSIIRADGTIVPPKGGGKDPGPEASIRRRTPLPAVAPKAPAKGTGAPKTVSTGASSMKMGRKKDIDGWEVYPVRAADGTEYGITHDGTGWYAYRADDESFVGDDYFDSPKQAFEDLENRQGSGKKGPRNGGPGTAGNDRNLSDGPRGRYNENTTNLDGPKPKRDVDITPTGKMIVEVRRTPKGYSIWSWDATGKYRGTTVVRGGPSQLLVELARITRIQRDFDNYKD